MTLYTIYDHCYIDCNFGKKSYITVKILFLLIKQTINIDTSLKH
jgi:hypothetical protein